MSTVLAQSTGEVTGTVTDASGAVIPNAEMRLTNAQTNVAVATVTTSEGIYRFSNLQPGVYVLTAQSASFTPARVPDIVVDVARTTRVDVALQAGPVGETVTVNAGAQLLDTETGTKGQIINSQQIENLPLQTRSPLSLLILTPGVVGAAGSTGIGRKGSDGTVLTSNWTINGGVRTGRGGWSEFIVDGISITNRRDGSILALPSTEGVQQFQVQSGGMSAEFGHTVGGVVNYVSKGGGNEFHGNLFETHRSTPLLARDALPAITTSTNTTVYNQFGGSVGGPVWIPKLYNGRNRTFFFFYYDGIRQVSNSPETATVPTAKMRTGDFSELSAGIFDPASNATPAQRTRFANNQIPVARFNPFGRKILDLVPLPNLPGTASNFVGPRETSFPIDNYTARFDHAFNERQRVLFKFTKVESRAFVDASLGQFDANSQDVIFPSRNYTGGYNFTITPTLVYNAALGYTRFHRQSIDLTGNTLGAALFGYSVTPAPEAGSLPNMIPRAGFDIYNAIGEGGTENQVAETFQINQSLAWVRGRHVWRFGADLRRYRSAGLLSGGTANGSFAFSQLQTSNGTSTTGNAAASLLLGLPNTLTIQQVPAITTNVVTPAFYAADDYKVLPNLTLNLGLRYEFEGKLRERYDRVGYFDAEAINSIAGRPGVFRYAGANGAPQGITAGDYDNFSPRVGFAYSPSFDKGRSVLRGAFGVYYSPLPSVGFYGAAQGFETTFSPIKPNATAPAVVLRDSYSLPPAAGPLGDAAALGLGLTEVYNRELNRPVVYQWNIGVQRELARNLVAEILYSGNRGQNLLSVNDINLAPQSLIDEAISVQQASGTAGAAQAFLNQTVPNPLAGKVPGTLGAATITRLNAARRFPHYGAVNVPQNNRDSHYHSLQAKVERRLSDDVSFLIGYTFSKMITNQTDANASPGAASGGAWQNLYDLRDARAVSTVDSAHNLTGNVVYELPFGKGKRFLNSGVLGYLVGGFRFTNILAVRSGLPLGVFQSAASGLPGGARPDLIGDPAAGRGTINANGSIQWISLAAYRTVNGRYGTAPIRDAHMRGPRFVNLDTGLHRDFKFTERVLLRFRAEAFNSLNHTNLRMPEQNFSSPAFGQINQSFDARVFQFGLELKF